MKQLYLVRHANTVGLDPELPDFQRPLNEQGQADSKQMGLTLHNENIQPDLIIASPALRAFSTAKNIAAGLNYPVENIAYDEHIYDASLEELLTVIANTDDAHQVLLIVGHNPGMSELVDFLSEQTGLRMGTCNVCAIEVDTEHWEDVKHCARNQIGFY